MRFAHLLVVATCVAGLTGCAAPGGKMTPTDEALNRCAKYYFKPGTPAMARCVEREASSGRSGTGDMKEADSAYVKCLGYGFRPGTDNVARCVQREVHRPGAGKDED